MLHAMRSTPHVHSAPIPRVHYVYVRRMFMVGLLLFVARRSSRSRAGTSPTAPAEVKPRVMESNDTYVVVD